MGLSLFTEIQTATQLQRPGEFTTVHWDTDSYTASTTRWVYHCSLRYRQLHSFNDQVSLLLFTEIQTATQLQRPGGFITVHWDTDSYTASTTRWVYHCSLRYRQLHSFNDQVSLSLFTEIQTATQLQRPGESITVHWDTDSYAASTTRWVYHCSLRYRQLHSFNDQVSLFTEIQTATQLQRPGESITVHWDTDSYTASTTRWVYHCSLRYRQLHSFNDQVSLSLFTEIQTATQLQRPGEFITVHWDTDSYTASTTRWVYHCSLRYRQLHSFNDQVSLSLFTEIQTATQLQWPGEFITVHWDTDSYTASTTRWVYHCSLRYRQLRSFNDQVSLSLFPEIQTATQLQRPGERNTGKCWKPLVYKYIVTSKSTRMHSSRIRTVRCSSHLGRGEEGVCPGVCLPRLWGGVSATHTHTHRHTLTCEQNHRRLWKHNLAATTLWTVMMGPRQLATRSHLLRVERLKENCLI